MEYSEKYLHKLVSAVLKKKPCQYRANKNTPWLPILDERQERLFELLGSGCHVRVAPTTKKKGLKRT